MLVLTDVGEEVDDEVSLYMMLETLQKSTSTYDFNYKVDVVFCTGNIDGRINRFADILKKLQDEGKFFNVNVNYFRFVNYQMWKIIKVENMMLYFKFLHLEIILQNLVI